MKTPSPEKVRQCKLIAFAGIVIMGIGSFMACLASQDNTLAGSAVLLAGIAVTAYGFTWWRP